MHPSLRPLIVVLVLGQAALLWWMSGQYGPRSGSAAEPKQGAGSRWDDLPVNTYGAKLGPKFPKTSSYSATVRIDLSKPSHTIRDEIYGASKFSREQVSEYGVPIVRWGGNRTTKYNWEQDADSSAGDWYFMNDSAHGGWFKFLDYYGQVGAGGYLTVPTIGFVAKDRSSYSFSVKKYGRQQATEMDHPDIGNGIVAGGQSAANDWRDASVEVGPEFMAQGVRKSLDHKKVERRQYYALDNEPMLWHSKHHDVRKKPLGREELWERTVQYAEAIRSADPHGKIAGFCSWGWKDLYTSAAEDAGELPNQSDPDRALGLAEWFIKKCGDYKRFHGKPLVDVFDFHWYPEAKVDDRRLHEDGGRDLAFNQIRLRTTRDLWDPAYRPESWIRNTNGGNATMVVRRIRGWIEKHNPGMEVSLGEYDFGGGDNISGALAQADVFGILARERVDLAFLWVTPKGSQELAWKLFRNYDRAGGRFGDRYVSCETKDHDLCVFAAKRSSDAATTIAIVNKDLGGECTVTLDVAGLKGQLRMFRFDQDTGNDVVEIVQSAGDVDGRITLTVPAASGTMIVIK